jgi:hypothetical protein
MMLQYKTPLVFRAILFWSSKFRSEYALYCIYTRHQAHAWLLPLQQHIKKHASLYFWSMDSKNVTVISLILLFLVPMHGCFFLDTNWEVEQHLWSDILDISFHSVFGKCGLYFYIHDFPHIHMYTLLFILPFLTRI